MTDPDPDPESPRS